MGNLIETIVAAVFVAAMVGINILLSAAPFLFVLWLVGFWS
jgi:hypothetical protein